MEKKEVYNLIEQHFRSNNVRLVKILSRYTRGRHNAEDIVQESYCRACQYWTSYDSEQEFNVWMHVILHNAVRDFMGKEYLSGMGDADALIVVESNALKRVELGELIDLIDKQPDNIRRILLLTFIEGYRSKEVEQVVPETAVNIRQIIVRFRREIKNEHSNR